MGENGSEGDRCLTGERKKGNLAEGVSRVGEEGTRSRTPRNNGVCGVKKIR